MATHVHHLRPGCWRPEPPDTGRRHGRNTSRCKAKGDRHHGELPSSQATGLLSHARLHRRLSLASPGERAAATVLARTHSPSMRVCGTRHSAELCSVVLLSRCWTEHGRRRGSLLDRALALLVLRFAAHRLRLAALILRIRRARPAVYESCRAPYGQIARLEAPVFLPVNLHQW